MELPRRRGDADRDKKSASFVQRVTTLQWRKARSTLAHPRFLALAVVAVLVPLLLTIGRGIRDVVELNRGLALYQSFGMPADTIPVLIPCYGRPHYLEQVLDALRKAHNVDKTVLVFSQDGSNPEVSRLIEGVNFTRSIRLQHYPPYLGIPSYFVRTDAPTAANVFYLLRFAMDYMGARAAIVLESDLVLSPDGLDYFRWAYESVSHSFKWRHKVFTINGYYEKSVEGVGDPYTFTTDDYGFMVWGWLCPDFSWPRIKAGWTWFHNWDITMEESIRRPSGLVSLSPMQSRTRNIGMQGINFNVNDPNEISKWHSLYIPNKPIDYSGKTPIVVSTAARAVDVSAAARSLGMSGAEAAGVAPVVQR